MDAAVIAALAKWPNVPAVFGWLRLDRRGNWLIREQQIRQPALAAFINRNYASDERGRHFFQNGPQRVFVDLDYAPWVVRLEAERLVTHTGEIVTADGGHIDDEGNMLFVWGKHAGLLDDRDLPAVLGGLQQLDGSPAEESMILQAIEQADTTLALGLGGRRLPVRPIRRDEVAGHFGFDPAPTAD